MISFENKTNQNHKTTRARVRWTLDAAFYINNWNIRIKDASKPQTVINAIIQKFLSLVSLFGGALWNKVDPR